MCSVQWHSTYFSQSSMRAVQAHPSQTLAIRLREHLLSDRPILSTIDVASLAMIGQFIVCTVRECTACAEYIAMLQEPNSSAPNHGVITYQDRGGLYYPTQEHVKVLIGLWRFADCVLSQRQPVKKPLEACVKRSVQELMSLPMLSCSNTVSDHLKVPLELTKAHQATFCKLCTRKNQHECYCEVS